MITTEKVHNIVFAVADGESSPKRCSACGNEYFREREKTKDGFTATFIDCIVCGEPHRIGGFAWPDSPEASACVHSDNKDYVCPYCHHKKVYIEADNSVGAKAIFVKK